MPERFRGLAHGRRELVYNIDIAIAIIILTAKVPLSEHGSDRNPCTPFGRGKEWSS